MTLSDPTIYLDYNWKTNKDNCRSDHYPIILERLETKLEEKIPRWNLQKAKWRHFKRLSYANLTPKPNINQKDHNTYFTKTLLTITEECIPKSFTQPKFNKHGTIIIMTMCAASKDFPDPL